MEEQDVEWGFTNVEPSHNWKPGKRMTTRKSVRHTIAAARSMLRSAARRKDFDLTNLTQLDEIDAPKEILQIAVDNLHARGHSWAEIGGALGVTREAAFQKYRQPV